MDDRARVPFALVGVLLLVSSATLATTVDPGRPPTDSDSEVVAERTAAAVQTELREAVRTASSDAAADPVVEPANTTAGRVLDDSTAFRDALRLQIYLRARERLSDVTVRKGDVTGTVSLPRPTTEEELRAAKRRVHVERADRNGTAIRVRIENVTLRTRQGGEVRSRRTVSPTVVVATPVLAAHDRVTEYQRRLDAGVTKPGLSQRLTTQLYALAWSRGYLQYGGVPISNVVSNQHVGVITNQALLALQRATIGHSDPRGRRTVAVAAARTTAQDLAATHQGPQAELVKTLAGGPTSPPGSDIQGLDPPKRSGPTETTRVAVNATADRAFLGVLDNETIEESVRSAYSVEVRTITRVDGDLAVSAPPPERPGENWTLVGGDRERTVRYRNVTVAPPAVPGRWHALERYSRQTVVTERVTRTWQRRTVGPNGSVEVERRTRTNRATTRRTVSVVLAGRHDRTSPAPNRPVETAHRRGAGPLSGPNLAAARERAVGRLTGRWGSRERVLEAGARGRLDSWRATLALARPNGYRDWIYRDLMALRERVRGVSVTVEKGAVGSFQRNPPAALADEVAAEHERLLDAPGTYRSTATKARIAARAAYLDRVESRLRDRADRRRDREGTFEQRLDEAGTSLDSVEKSLEARDRPVPERQPRLSGVGGEMRLTADAAPSYLTQAELSHEEVPAVENRSHPLVARNVNVFSVPYQTAADGLAKWLFGPRDRVRLDIAARTLEATNATLAAVNLTAVYGNGSVADSPGARSRAARRRAGNVSTLLGRRTRLQRAVSSSAEAVLAEQRAVLRRQGIGDNRSARGAMLRAATAPWNTTHARALAVANGSVSHRLVAVASRRGDLSVTERDRLALRLNATLAESLRSGAAQPAVGPVNRSRSGAYKVGRDLLRESASRAAERGTKELYRKGMQRSFERMPSGLPIAPAPGYWYATANVWHVTVRGEYARFGVRVSRGRPTTPGGEFVYARDGESVALDVDGDGREERLGRSTRVDFEASATVLVVVPPGKSGVGDTNGVTVEESAGWPRPG